MSKDKKRIAVAPDPADWESAAEAAPLLESHVPDPARTVPGERSATSRAAELSQEDLALVERFLDEHPGWIEEHVRRAREATAGIPFREPAPEERL